MTRFEPAFAFIFVFERNVSNKESKIAICAMCAGRLPLALHFAKRDRRKYDKPIGILELWQGLQCAYTIYNVFGSAMPRWAGRPMPLGMCLE